MNATQKPYPSTKFDPLMVEVLLNDDEAFGTYNVPRTYRGFTLINDHIVPEKFILSVIAELKGHQFEYDLVRSKWDLFSVNFLASLTEIEDNVLMPVVLQIIARNEFPKFYNTEADHEEKEGA